MNAVRAQTGPFTVVAYRGDAKTMLAFDLSTVESRTRLAGFTIRVQPPGDEPAYFLRNKLAFKNPSMHAQSPNEPAKSSVNSPLHRFRWVHHPGLYHQGLNAVMGEYEYTIVPRYFDDKASMLALDPSLGVTIQITVDKFAKGNLAVGFTRGFVQSQAFVDNFDHARIEPSDHGLLWDTSVVAGNHADGAKFTYEEMYQWLGFTARDRIYQLLDTVLATPAQSVDVFAYDLSDAGFARRLLDLAAEGRVRMILDDSALHHNKTDPVDPKHVKPEDEFEALFNAADDGKLKRGHFSRYSHDKVIIVSDGLGPERVLTGSTNFSTTGLNVNSNHVLVFDDRTVAMRYHDVFEETWNDDVHTAAFKKSALATQRFDPVAAGVPNTSITFSPHPAPVARQVLDGIAQRVDAERSTQGAPASVLFAVMGLEGGSDNPVYETLKTVHERTDVFSYGITDTTNGIALYQPGKKTGVLVTGKPKDTVLPKPFNQVPSFSYHQVHHKFVVCGIKGDDPVVYCGSSNLALTGEQVNGDNLLEIHDPDIAMVFAIEALELVDHFEFLDGQSKSTGVPMAHLVSDPASAPEWYLGTTDRWVRKYFDSNDLYSSERSLFAS